MAERRLERRVRLALAWVLSAALLGGYALIEGREGDERPAPPGPVIACPEGEDLDILAVDPGEPAPGSAVEVAYGCAAPEAEAPVRALLSIPAGDKTEVREPEVLSRGRGRL